MEHVSRTFYFFNHIDGLAQDCCYSTADHIEWLSTIETLYDGNPQFTDEFPSQRASNVKLWCFILW